MSTLDITIDFPTQRRLLGVGLVGSLTVMVCNTILYAHGDVMAWSQWSMNLAYWAGSFALAFAGVGFVPTYTALRPAGTIWALGPALLLGAFLALGSAGHGSFFAHYSAHRAVTSAAHDPSIASAMELLRTELALDNLAMFVIALSACVIGSIWYSLTVLLRPTLYPRWMAAWNVFAISLVVFALAEVDAVPDLIQIMAKGLGFHLAIAGYFLLSWRFLSKHERATAQGGGS